MDLNSEKNFRVEEFKKKYNESYSINHIISLKASKTNLQKVEHDLRFIKLVFPPKKDKSWDGNIYIDEIDENTLEYFNPKKYNWEYIYTEIDVKKEIGNFVFDSCLVVTQIDEENLFEKKYSKEIYAKHIGLVSKELIILNTQAPPSNKPFIERAENGFILKYTITDYKK